MEEPVSQRHRPSRRSGSIRGLVLFAIIAFAIGLGAMGWILSHSESVRRFVLRLPSSPTIVSPTAPKPVARPISHTDAEARLAAIESRLVRAEQRSYAAYADAARAERLLILVASRRAIDRGQPLGALESGLQRQFGDEHASDVSTVIKGARQPVTLAQLTADLATEESHLGGTPGDEGWLGSVWQNIGALAVIRRADSRLRLPPAGWSARTKL